MGMDIHVSQVRSVLVDAAGDFDELEAVRVRLSQQEQALAQALAGEYQSCPEIVEAVTGIYADILEPDLSAILTRCNNAVEGVAAALDEYEKGNEQMMVNAQRAAASLPAGYEPSGDRNSYRPRPVE